MRYRIQTMHSTFLRKLCRLFFLIVAIAPTAAPAQVRSYFEMRENFSADVNPFPKWTGMQGRYAAEMRLNDEDCGLSRFHPCEAKEWKKLTQRWNATPFREMIEAVNDFGNSHPYTPDTINWGIEDYWEAPYEFLSISGDCEDYAIIKYYSLRAAGIPASRLRIIVLQDFNLGGVIHAVLGVYDNEGRLYILDNQIRQVMPALRIFHYKPIYGINEEGWWAYYPL